MRNSVSHLLSRLLNSGAAFAAPPAHDNAANRERPSQDPRQSDTEQHNAPKGKELSAGVDHETINR